MRQTVYIATASSDGYAPFLCVLLRSILDHIADDHRYAIFVLDDGIRPPRKKKIENMARFLPNVSIQFFDIDRPLSASNLYTHGHIGRTTYAKLSLLELPEEVDKLLYLDADTIVNVDPAELYSIDLLSNDLAAVRDPMMTSWCIGKQRTSELENLARLGIADCREYFNAGVMLIDLKRWRAQYTTDFFFQKAASREWLWLDQDILNQVFYHHALYLDQTWNFMTCTEDKHRALLFEQLGYPYQQKSKPKIIHYAGHTIPCYRPRVINGRYFWRYACRSPFFGIIFMHLCQHLLHKISKINTRAPKKA